MLSAENNKLITSTGPGTPMGEYLRRFWIPALTPRELPAPDCPPLRLRLLGEDLIAFRTTSGSVGLIQNACPHRGASLFFGRNEENGLRCVYHGWKFDTDGRCVDMPSEPSESNFKTKVRATAYPTLERGDIVWAYMGPPECMPELPPYEWTQVPEGHVHVTRRIQACNYLQGIEGGIDSSHVPFLHGTLEAQRLGRERAGGGGGEALMRGDPNRIYLYADMAPRLTVMQTDYGFAYGAQRDAEVDSYYWRLTPFLFPFFTVIPGFTVTSQSDPALADSLTYSGHGWVPMDDENCWMFTYSWNVSRPLGEREGHPAHWVDVDPRTLRSVANAGNDYFLDREVQRTQTFTGIENGSMQDAGIQESMGAVFDRTREHLGTTDAAIIHLRKMYLDGARQILEGGEPWLPGMPSAFQVRSVSAVLDRQVPFLECTRYMDIVRG
jgi:phenylpropionate dioxygenase-like ring-hydroxylating dioxygenase large terminal subunit